MLFVKTKKSIIEVKAGDSGVTLEGSPFEDSIIGGAGADTIVGGDGNDTIVGGGAADSISGGDGNDVLEVGAGDTVFWRCGNRHNSPRFVSTGCR